MKPHLARITCLLLLALVSGLPAALSPPPADKDPWLAVEEAMAKGLPKTAIEHLEPIIAESLAQGDQPQAVKALGTKIALEGQIQGSRAEELITRLEEAIPKWPEQAHPILETVLAQWYWSFFQQNRWRFLKRTRSAEPPGDDILSWDLPRILAEIDAHFHAALADPQALTGIPIASYDALLEKGNVPDSYRPTLYDFIAHEALRFYQAGEQAGSSVRDAFILSADSPALGSSDEFLAWQIETTDTTSPKFKAALLLQDLLTSHRTAGDDRRDAFLDAELARILWAESQASGENLQQRACAALERFATDHADHPLSARARARWAQLLRSAEQPAAAHRVATVGKRAFPDTPGGNQCHNLVAQIEQPHSQVYAERVWNSSPPEITLHYRNLGKAHFRLVRYDWQELVQHKAWRIGNVDHEFLTKLIGREPTIEWSADLPPTEDFVDRNETIRVPGGANLAPGYYFVLASHHEDFTRTDSNKTHYLGCWVSDLALVTRGTWGSGTVSGLVLHAVTGEPIAGAEVSAYQRQDDNTRGRIDTTSSDADGLFSMQIPGDGYRQVSLHAMHGDHQVATLEDARVGQPRNRESTFSRSFLFTDRSLYRPGQTIAFKAIATRYDPTQNDYQVLADQKLTVYFRDANGEEIASQELRSNRFGSLHGHFTAPRDRLTGRMRIVIEGEAPGQALVNVEEYKRPKFQVEIEPPETPAKLGDEATIVATATAYTGAPIDGAQVSYRVVRQVRFPAWQRWCVWPPMPPVQPQEIAHGSTTTGTDGSFQITFPTHPDPEIAPNNEPVFHFTVHADVTDLTGETRSAELGIQVGYTALQASMGANTWQEKDKPVTVTASTRSLDSQPLAAAGTIIIHRLQQPDRVHRGGLQRTRDGQPDLSSPNNWQLAEAVADKPFQTDASGNTTVEFKLAPGHYRAVLATADRFGKPVSALLPITVLDPEADHCQLLVPSQVAAPRWQFEPGEEFRALWSTGYDEGRAFLEIAHRRKTIHSLWTDPGRTQQAIVLPVTEELRGGFTLRVTQLRENRAYLTEHLVQVPWTNKNLQVRWEHFTSKLEPGEKQTWSAIVTGPDAERAVAEVAAVLYDESLDAFLPHQWPNRLSVFYNDNSQLSPRFHNRFDAFHHGLGHWNYQQRSAALKYRSLPARLQFTRPPSLGRVFRSSVATSAPAPMAAMAAEQGLSEDPFGADDEGTTARQDAAESAADPFGESAAANAADLDQVTVRSKLQETALFLPQMTTDEDGKVRIEFTAPEALSSWKFMAFAHDTELRSGLLQDSAVTTSGILVQPNPPRFLREADTLEFTVKVVNTSPTTQTGNVRLTLTEARSGASADQALGNTGNTRDFEIPANESRSFAWRLEVPDGTPLLTYRAVASTGRLSDGEEGFVPVLPRRSLVTESLPLPVRSAGTHHFEFSKLLAAADSDSLQHQSLTVQMVSNPAWYAVMALPYLMEFPHQCSEQVFSRLYANALARHIALSDPKIRNVFDQWQTAGGDTLESPLENNEDLVQLMLEETPWLRDAADEATARRNVGLLFDDNRLSSEIARAARQLAEAQREDGAWPWFPGGPASDHITLHITTGLARLRHLGVEHVDLQPALRALAHLDGWIEQSYRRILEHPDSRDKNHLTPAIAFYLYGRSFYLDDKPIEDRHREALDYFLGQAKEYWLEIGNRQSQAHLALALQRFGKDQATPQDILASLREHAVSDAELGMFWRDTELSWWWYRAPIETQALMIEAFDEVAKDPDAVEELKIWLLKQKQTRDWKTTKATADAVYALLLRGTDLLASDALVRVKLGDREIEPAKVEAGTGFYEERLQAAEISPAMGQVEVSKEDQGVAWGGLHWQYLESLEKITPHQGTPLTLVKKIFKKENSDAGPVLHAVKPGAPLAVGDELVVRLELRSDRDMEYLHLKDQRGSGTEPVDVLSGYRYQDGLAFYQSTRDTASHFFIDYLPKGTYVFEYSLRIQHRGHYQSGMANIQCMYAPEFNSHSQSFLTDVE